MPAALPANVKLLHGRSEGKDSAGRPVKPVPKFKRVAPEPPAFLSREAKAEWRRVVPGLQRLELLKPEDRGALAAYCESWATFVEATKTVHEEGLTIEAKQGLLAHPAVAIARNAGREMRTWAGKFGLTPVDESALTVEVDDGGQDNPFG
jgi:P27 family predicted phage terminase small subunit